MTAVSRSAPNRVHDADAVVRVACSVALSEPEKFGELWAAFADVLHEQALEHRHGIMALMRGAAPQWTAWQNAIGDAEPLSRFVELSGTLDDGRLHAVSAEGFTQPRRHDLGIGRSAPITAPASRAFAEGGWYVLRSGHDHAIVRCGSVGLNGAGSHEHNDQLSYELVIQGRRIVSDSLAAGVRLDIGEQTIVDPDCRPHASKHQVCASRCQAG